MSKRILIIGTGFAGIWSALAAKLVRPRLYEAHASNLTHAVGPLFKEAGIEFVQGTVTTINAESNSVLVRSASGTESNIAYDRLILAARSSVVRPKSISGVHEYAFNIDSLDAAVKLEAHLHTLSSLPSSPARDTIVVCGSGFTGLEIATELPNRISNPHTKIIVVESADQLGPELGPGPRPIITQALDGLHIEYKLGSPVTAIDADSVTLASGERIETKTAIWTAGMRATPLTQQIPAPKDNLSRLKVDRHLRVPLFNNIYATGDAAHAAVDDLGHFTLQSCQHAMPMGRVSGHNATADLLGEPLMEYQQIWYNLCLDLGAWGTVVAQGWEREVKLTGDVAKRGKQFINQKLIYPPVDAGEALKQANPVGPSTDQIFEYVIKAVA
ncbi:pyridine nucleotide-disulfide oxidoreductase family protein [Aspergillus granulosus]|uniref:Pyridine nucleotide-disulfide oxidoreductase family protein n=1 Tax=Aspergillus granulosus TaxID=176169 RepID=A0ABR4I3U0_9EURO